MIFNSIYSGCIDCICIFHFIVYLYWGLCVGFLEKVSAG